MEINKIINPAPPVLLLIFNRPDTTASVMEALRSIQPPYLFIAADGPRAEVPDDLAKTENARKIALTIDWPCKVETLFRDENLGCGNAVGNSIDWFFENVEEGIILEDDCVPDPSFFLFAKELLARYRDDYRVMAIGAKHFQGSSHQPPSSYYFSRYNHCWGWASWRRAWNLYDKDMSLWPKLRESEWLFQIGNNSRSFQRYWTMIFDQVYNGKIDTWSYRWTFSCWAQNGLSILPSRNLVKNIGFGCDATHTKKKNNLESKLKLESINHPIIHPSFITQDVEADRWSDRNVCGINQWTSIKYQISKIPGMYALAEMLRGK